MSVSWDFKELHSKVTWVRSRGFQELYELQERSRDTVLDFMGFQRRSRGVHVLFRRFYE